jgi:phosphosulfolactate phosphohydrolase-like enzyme
MNGPEAQVPRSTETLARTLRETQGGRNLIALGLERDIDAAAQIDKIRLVPELDTRSWRITAAMP